MTLKVGTRLGPYTVLGPLGAGGMGEVYRARDSRLGRDVAVKVLPQGTAISPEDRARLRREAKVISSLNHPNICVLHDIGQEGDTDYLVMELVEGETLARRISRGPLPTAEVLRIGAQIADALDRAHRAGVVHRDLKPGNVMLTRSGAKLLDFGLARELRPDGRDPEATVTEPGAGHGSEESITRRGMVVGTFQYMAPEQLEGKRVDARCDNWALGCVLYEMATGKRAFEGSNPMSVISAILRDEPRRMSDLAPLTPPALEWVVKTCLAKDPDNRIQTAHDVRLQLDWLATSRVAPADATPAKQRTRMFAILGLVVALLLLAAVGAFAVRHVRDTGQQFGFELMTHRPMTIFRAAFLSDGGSVVFSAAMKGSIPQLYVIRPEFPDPQPIGDPGTHLLSASSRGELAVLTNPQVWGSSTFGGTLARMPVGGGAPRELLQDVIDADWDTDGSHLAIIRSGDGRVRIEYPIGVVLYQSAGFLSDLRFSPKGDKLAFFENMSGRFGSGTELKVVDLKGKSRSLLKGHALSGLAWGHDGRAVFVSGMIDSVRDAVYTVDMFRKTRIVLQSAGGLRLHDAAGDGRLMATRDDGRQSVMVHRPEWQEDRDLSWLDASTDGRLTKDGHLLVFTEQSSRIGGNSGTVCVRKTDGSPVVRLCRGVSYMISPDRNWVITVDLSKPQTLILQPIGVGEAKPLSRGSIETFYGAWWFPSGDSILIMGQAPSRPFRLYVQDLVGGLPRPLTEEGTLQPAIAYDGSWIVVRKVRAGYSRYRFDGSPPQAVPWLTSKDILLPNVVDAQTVLVASGRSLPYRIQKVDLTNGRRSPFLQLSPPDPAGLTFCRISDFSEDFRSYAYEAAWTVSSLFLIRPTKHDAK